MFELKTKNKNIWSYRFLYYNNEESSLIFYTIDTAYGLKYAENIAWGNATFDGCRNMKYLGKNKIESVNITNKLAYKVIKQKREVENGTNA